MPTFCFLLPSSTNSRSLLVSVTLPEGFSSASSELAATGTFKVITPPPGVIVTEIESLAVNGLLVGSPLSVTEAVMVCGPSERVEVLTEAAVPKEPSRLDDHTILSLSVPSSVSVAVPSKVTKVPLIKEAPGSGESIVTVGGVFTGVAEMVTEMVSVTVNGLLVGSPLSVTEAVMV